MVELVKMEDTYKIRANNLIICDDVIAAAFDDRPTDSMKVGSALLDIQTFLRVGGLPYDIDLSDNIISDQGALQIAESFSQIGGEPEIRCLNLSWNRIRDGAMMVLLTILTPMLRNDKFKTLDVTGNYGGNIICINRYIDGLDPDDAEKIREKIVY